MPIQKRLKGSTFTSNCDTASAQAQKYPYTGQYHRELKDSLKYSYLCFVFAGVLLIAAVFAGWPSDWQTGLAKEAQWDSNLQEPGPANGVFPHGCKWRDVQSVRQRKDFWAVESYEYWQEDEGRWSRGRPKSCSLEGYSAPTRYNNGSWILLVGDGAPEIEWWSMTRNIDLKIQYAANTTDFVRELSSHRVVSGGTLILDFPFFHHPTAIGHWGEVMYPLYSILREEKQFQLPPDRFVLLHLKRSHLMEWARAVIAATLGLAKGELLPSILMQEEHSEIRQQIVQPLEGVSVSEWLCFENSLVVTDLPPKDQHSGWLDPGGSPFAGLRTFANTKDARHFRMQIYANHGLPPPSYSIPPRMITYQKKRANRRVVNEMELIQLLSLYGKVQIVEFNASTPMEDQLRIIAGTGVFVSVHTSNLANAHFLQPGSAVFEIIQQNWFWAGLDLTFKTQTQMMGDIHHFAWRATLPNQTVYLGKQDEQRSANWTQGRCDSEDCVEAHTNVDVVVNLHDFKTLLESRLPFVFNGTDVADAELPWPGRGFVGSS